MLSTNAVYLGTAPPHSCDHCASFVIDLYDKPGADRKTSPFFSSHTPSQHRLARQLGLTDDDSPEGTQRLKTFYDATIQMSFYPEELTLAEIQRYGQDGCKLFERIWTCLNDSAAWPPRPKRFIIGAFISTDLLTLGYLDIDDFDEFLWQELICGGDGGYVTAANEFTLMSLPDTPTAEIIEHRPIVLDPASDEFILEAKRWLWNCMECHSTCKPYTSGFMPTRLIEITAQEDHTSYRLFAPPQTETSPYAVLSYCWGGDQDFKTTLATLDHNTMRIDFDKLPRTIQDVLNVAFRLGLKYVWIDALCIIQDSDEDKGREIARMAQVYGCAAITILASRAGAVWEGFLHPRKPVDSDLSDLVFELPCRIPSSDTSGSVILLPIYDDPLEATDRRGWTFQERVLSPRVLEFGSLRTQCICRGNGGFVPSDGWSHKPATLPYSTDGASNGQEFLELFSGNSSAEHIRWWWMNVIETFSGRTLGFHGDKLPALGGLAQRFASLIHDDDRYVAGYWRNAMPGCLTWYSVHDGTEPPPEISNGTPSWSWAKMVGGVAFEREFTGNDPLAVCEESTVWTSFSARIEDITVKLSDPCQPYGSVAIGSLRLVGSAHKVSRTRHRANGVFHERLVPLPASDCDNPVPKGLDLSTIAFKVDYLEPELADGDVPVWLVRLGIVEYPKGLMHRTFGLVLKAESNEEESYTRVGMYWIMLEDGEFELCVDWFNRAGEKAFLIN